MKKEKKLQKIYRPHYNLLKAQDLWQAHYQVLPIILLNEFMKLYLNPNAMIKQVKLAELNIDIASIFLNTQILKVI